MQDRFFGEKSMGSIPGLLKAKHSFIDVSSAMHTIDNLKSFPDSNYNVDVILSYSSNI